MKFYQQKMTKQLIEVSKPCLQKIYQGADSAFVGPLAHLFSVERSRKLIPILSIFSVKRPDIGYCPGMNHISAVVVSVFSNECDAFVAFSHIIENIFPAEFFAQGNRLTGYHSELRALAMMAERVLPDLARSLTAVYGDSTKDVLPFNFTLKRSAENLFNSLFSTSLMYNDLLRVWDVLMVYKFDFAQKFAVCLLRTKEKSFKSFVVQQTKNLGAVSYTHLTLPTNREV